MSRSIQPFRGVKVITSLAVTAILLITLIVSFTHNQPLSAQVADERDVVYKTCRYFLDGLKGQRINGPHPSCGIDEAATRAAREKRERTETLRREIESQKRALTPVEEQQVTEHLDQRFDASGNRHTELQDFLTGVETRLGDLLASETYRFNDEETRQLTDAQALVASLTTEYDRPNVTKDDVRTARDQLSPLLTDIQAMLTQKQRIASEDGPRIENLVLRIDDLVARVGTVIRDLELGGQRVPSEVSRGQRRTLALVREAKRICSTSRPEGCWQLREVLEIIEAMREPLCAVDSPVVTFCR